jgi:hypothetical protein
MNQLEQQAQEEFFEDQFTYNLNSSKFSLEVEKVVKERNLDYIDAICLLCEKYEIEFKSVAKLISPTMKDKIEVDALKRKYKL